MVGASPSFGRPSSLPIHDCSFVLSNCSADNADGGPKLALAAFRSLGLGKVMRKSRLLGGYVLSPYVQTFWKSVFDL
jgi:hypothetical protein